MIGRPIIKTVVKFYERLLNEINFCAARIDTAGVKGFLWECPESFENWMRGELGELLEILGALPFLPEI
jgi:hypothetical protein